MERAFLNREMLCCMVLGSDLLGVKISYLQCLVSEPSCYQPKRHGKYLLQKNPLKERKVDTNVNSTIMIYI